MLKRYHQVIGSLFILLDAAVVGTVWLLSFWLRFNFPLIPVTKGFPNFATYAALLPLIIILWLMVLGSSGIYRPKKILRRTEEAHLVLKAHFVAILIFIALTYLFSEYKYSRGVMIYFGILGGFLLVFARVSARNFLRSIRRKGFKQTRVLAVGDGALMQSLIAGLEKFPELGLKVIGIAVRQPGSQQTFAEKPVVGSYSELGKLIREYQVEELLIGLPREQSGDLDRILQTIKDEIIDIRLVPDVHEYVTLGCEVENFNGHPIININDSPLEGLGSILKRMTDMSVAALALVLLSPLLILLALITKLTSTGPVFYKQERMGLDGRTFQMLKFRSMKVDAESGTGAVWAKKEDARRTSWGMFLRATSLDELPQLFNVFKGEMSLVGPRPERPVFVQKFRGEIPNYMLRHKVKSGMTGWAQINGWRGNTSLRSRIECDLYYIQNWSYAWDWKIMVLTLWRGFLNKNAY